MEVYLWLKNLLVNLNMKETAEVLGGTYVVNAMEILIHQINIADIVEGGYYGRLH
jgi:hypothetical protein